MNMDSAGQGTRARAAPHPAPPGARFSAARAPPPPPPPQPLPYSSAAPQYPRAPDFLARDGRSVHLRLLPSGPPDLRWDWRPPPLNWVSLTPGGFRSIIHPLPLLAVPASVPAQGVGDTQVALDPGLVSWAAPGGQRR